ncbi:TPA: AAA family ATPase, partial [Klebsiella pneumoniae]|nr:AAA family ATPase [Klebsiella pneumoniae]
TTIDVEKAYQNAVQKGAIIEGEARYQSTQDPAQIYTRKEWIDLLKQNGMSGDKARFTVDEGIKKGRLTKISHQVTTVEGIRLERSILTIESRGRGIMPRQLTAEVAGQLLAGKTLKQEQMRAVTEIVTSKDRFVAAHGYAGTGKSYMTMAAKELLESQGLKVTALAPYGTQKKALEDDGLPARTVAAFLKSKDKKLDEKSVVFIDEAGVIPARQMKQLMEVIEKHNARAVFLGDTSQTKAVEAGKPFEQLIKAGMQTSYMKDIQRQKNEVLLEAVKYAAEGNATRALKNITVVNQYQEEEKRLAKLADRYLSLPSEQQDATLIISGTNASRKTLNDYIRGNLGLTGTGEKFTLLDRVDTTQAERRDSRYFSRDQIIIPEQDYKNGMKRGESYRVLDTGPGNKLTVEGQNGEVISFSPRTHTKLSVYEAVSAELAPGDKVMVTRNDKTLDVANGDRFTVKAVEGEKLTLEDRKGRTVELDKKQASYLSYAYATTVHKSQGLTCDRVLFNIDTKSLTTSKDVFYVGISRARHEVEIFTNSEESLAASVSRDSPKTTATEIERFLGLEARFRDIGRNTIPGTGAAEKNGPEDTGEKMPFNPKPDEHNLNSGTDYQPVSNAEDAFHLKQNPMDDSVGLRRHEAHQNDAELAHEYAAADDHQWSGQDYADYEHYAEAADDGFDSSIYEDYAMPQTSQAEQGHAVKERTHEHDEGGHEI